MSTSHDSGVQAGIRTSRMLLVSPRPAGSRCSGGHQNARAVARKSRTMSAVIALLFVLSLSLLVTRLATAALMLTGVSHQLARLQALSALTGVGFTTSESERIVDNPVRRRILILMMLVGNAGFVTEASTLVLSFVGVTTRADARTGRTSACLGARRRFGRATGSFSTGATSGSGSWTVAAAGNPACRRIAGPWPTKSETGCISHDRMRPSCLARPEANRPPDPSQATGLPPG